MLIACVPRAPTLTIAYDPKGRTGTAPTDTNAYLAGAKATRNQGPACTRTKTKRTEPLGQSVSELLRDHMVGRVGLEPITR